MTFLGFPLVFMYLYVRHKCFISRMLAIIRCWPPSAVAAKPHRRRGIEDVANLLSSGEVPNLYASDELSAVRASVEKPAKEAGIQQNPEAMFSFFISRVRENLHVGGSILFPTHKIYGKYETYKIYKNSQNI